MSLREKKAGLRFRTRLTLTIMIVFVVAGVGLLAVEYAIVNGLFTTAITDAVHVNKTEGVLIESAQARPMTDVVIPDDEVLFPGVPTSEDVDPFMVSSGEFAVQAELASEVLAGMLIWSAVALVVFAVLAALAASWLARRSLRRIAEVTAMTKDLSTEDLHRRLDLPGPTDEIKELGDTIDGMLDRLETAFTAQQRFVSNASHELRTPLTTSRAALEIPLAQGRVPLELEGAVRTSLRAGQQSERLITALLALTQGADTQIERSAEDLSAVVDQAVMDARGQATRSGIKIKNRQLTSVMINADATMIEQAVTNLIDNAVVHNRAGGEIEIDSKIIGDQVELKISNTGPVLDPEVVELLREPFYRAADSRLSKPVTANGRSVGLGLSIVDSIASKHGGELVLSGRTGGGLIAKLILPLRETPRPAPALPEPVEAPDRSVTRADAVPVS